MQLQLTPAQQARLTELADPEDTGADTLAKAAALRLLDEDARFRAAVQEGIVAADRGEFLSDEEVWANVDRMIQS